MNQVNLLGRLTADPELRQTQSGIASCRFTIAVNRRFKNENGEYDINTFYCHGDAAPYGRMNYVYSEVK